MGLCLYITIFYILSSMIFGNVLLFSLALMIWFVPWNNHYTILYMQCACCIEAYYNVEICTCCLMRSIGLKAKEKMETACCYQGHKALSLLTGYTNTVRFLLIMQRRCVWCRRLVRVKDLFLQVFADSSLRVIHRKEKRIMNQLILFNLSQRPLKSSSNALISYSKERLIYRYACHLLLPHPHKQNLALSPTLGVKVAGPIRLPPDPLSLSWGIC